MAITRLLWNGKWRFRLKVLGVLVAALPMLGACADYTSPDNSILLQDEAEVDPDPWEKFNRGMFKVHTVLDTALVRPVAQAYRTVVPELGREGVSNVLENLRSPIDFVNSLLQGDVENSFAVFWRFALNTTFGFGGIRDFAAADAHLRARPADFGQTLAVYGVGSGPYLFLPLLGPSTLRDTGGRGADTAFDPVTYAGDDWRWLAYAKAGMMGIDFRAQNMELIDNITRNSLDPYVTYRSGYLQHRANSIRKALASGGLKTVVSGRAASSTAQ